MTTPIVESRDITFDDIKLIIEDLDMFECKVKCSRSRNIEAGSLSVEISGSFRPHLQAPGIGFSDFEFVQYIWHRILEHTKDHLSVEPIKMQPIRFRTSDINKNAALDFRESTLSELPDYRERGNRRIDKWIGDIKELL